MNEPFRRGAASALVLALTPLVAQSWRADIEIPNSDIQAVFNERFAHGHYLPNFTVRSTTSGLVYQMVWSSAMPSGLFLAKSGMSSAFHQQQIQTDAQVGHFPSRWTPGATTPMSPAPPCGRAR
ncbi:MAG TPA: hypothetical protein VK081_12705 [Planctomycetota bacterium]|nr:hypothetical protein [Planctomycetota bacterium]